MYNFRPEPQPWRISGMRKKYCMVGYAGGLTDVKKKLTLKFRRVQKWVA